MVTRIAIKLAQAIVSLYKPQYEVTKFQEAMLTVDTLHATIAEAAIHMTTEAHVDKLVLKYNRLTGMQKEWGMGSRRQISRKTISSIQ